VAAVRQTTVLFADVIGSSRLYTTAGDVEASAAISICMKALRRVAEGIGGRVVKTMGDELMVLFTEPDQGADAAARMQAAMEALPAVGGRRLELRIGFHAGPVLQRENDVFGDTVNLASRLVEQATQGQVITSADTVQMLSPVVRNATRPLYDITVKGKLEDVSLCELLWKKSPDVTDVPTGNRAPGVPLAVLRLRFDGRELRFRRMRESVSVGRDAGCTLVVANPAASRQHCTIERRQDKFVLRDHSLNGTYVAEDGEVRETWLRREELTLRAHGWVSFGQPRAEAPAVLEYWLETPDEV